MHTLFKPKNLLNLITQVEIEWLSYSGRKVAILQDSGRKMVISQDSDRKMHILQESGRNLAKLCIFLQDFCQNLAR